MTPIPVATLALTAAILAAPAVTPIDRAHSPVRATSDSVAQRLQAELAPFVRGLVDRDEFSGVIVVARNGAPIYSEAVGMADQGHHTPNTLATRFNIGSMDKMFTGVAIAQLVQAGKISLDGMIGTYLPGYPNADVREHVSVRQLLTHSSGLGSYFERGYLRNRVRIERAADLLPFFAEDSLAFRPGARMSYSNAGFAVLGAIIERVSGESYFDYVQQHIFAVAGMTATGFDDASQPAPGRAIGYTHPPTPAGDPSNGPREPNLALVEVRGGPAGGGFSTAHDLVAFGRALWAGTFMSRALVDQFTTGVMPMGPSIKYALGFGDLRINGVRAVGHNGGGPGINAEFDSYPDAGYDVVVLSNYDGPSATVVIDKVRELLMGGRRQ